MQAIILALLLSFFAATTGFTEPTPSASLQLDGRSSSTSSAEASSAAVISNPQAVKAVIDNYTPPKILNKNLRRFPSNEMEENGYEGWVIVNMMIDSKGSPYEVIVVDSIGNPALEWEAVKRVRRMRFEPATLNGAPIDASLTMQHTFSWPGSAKGAGREFVKGYETFTNAIKTNDRATADTLLATLKAQNLYEDAYLNLGRFLYSRSWENPQHQQQIDALRHATGHNNNSSFLPKNLLPSALWNLFVIQTQMGDYAGAIATAKRFDKEQRNDPAVVMALTEIETLRNDARAFAIHGNISPRGFWSLGPLKRHFSIDIAAGKLAEIKLLCERKYVLFSYRPELQYNIPDKFGACNMELFGDPGTTFTLVQS